MRRILLLVSTLAVFAGLTACLPSPQPDLTEWKDRIENVEPSDAVGPIVKGIINEAIRAGIPVVCPIVVSQAAPEFRAFITATCDSIAASNDPYTSLIEVLPVLCAGDPPLGATVFPNLAPLIIGGCPFLLQLLPLLDLPFLSSPSRTAG